LESYSSTSIGSSNHIYIDLSPDLRVEVQTMWPSSLSKLLVSSSLGFIYGLLDVVYRVF